MTLRRQLILLAGAMCLPWGVAQAGSEDLSSKTKEQQITFGLHGHILANFNIWSPDSQWIVYDCRQAGEKFDATRIEMVNVATGETQPLFISQNDAACGVATWSPDGDRIVFILGPEHPAQEWNYAVSRRRGAFVQIGQPDSYRPMDAMNYAPPFVSGALRGGTHVHVFNPAGNRVSYSYDDEVLRQSRDADETPVFTQRNIGVSAPNGPVNVARNHPRNNDGDWFSTVVTRTVSNPRPGSDEVGDSLEEGWIGTEGYVRADGTRQKSALAFQGKIMGKNGQPLREVFVLDLPEDLTIEGDAPLAGTDDALPAPPKGTTQRRITFTEDRKHPGVDGPRHWLRSSPDGDRIAFLMKDDTDIVQIYLVSPRGGEITQLTSNPWSVASTFTWSPDGLWISYVMDNSVFVTELSSGKSFRLTQRSSDESAPYRSACVFSPDGKSIAFLRPCAGLLQIFTVSMPHDI